MLIRNAQWQFAHCCDVRVAAGRIVEIAAGLLAQAGEPVIDANGGALLPGLHDHHLHLYSLAAALASVPCGPPQVETTAELATQLQRHAQPLAVGSWIRGIGYHESVSGELTLSALDALVPGHPVRIQHRSGRLWLLNSAALAIVHAANGDDPLERVDGGVTGRLYDADDWLRSRLPPQVQSLALASQLLARYGVTGVTDTTPQNTLASWAGFRAAQARGELRQKLMLMGDASLDTAVSQPRLLRGAHKFHLHEHALPDFDALVAAIAQSHRHGRAAAFHCVTRTDLVFALTALNTAGVLAGDRIEHASVAPPELLAAMADSGLTVVTQPHFIAERGDAYLQRVAADDQPWLYRLQGLLDAGIALAGGSDAPFGDANPWAAMQAAVTRTTRTGQVIGRHEALSPERALALFTTAPDAPGGLARQLQLGASADLCLLDRPWSAARADLAAVQVRLTLCDGKPIYAAGDVIRAE